MFTVFVKTVVATIDYYRFYFRVYMQYISGFECVHKVVLYTVNMFTVIVNMFTVFVKTVVATIDYYRFYFRVYVQYISSFECVHKVVCLQYL